ncbi:MAG: ATP-binding protein [Verrucomicrobiota bacterium]
MRDLSIQHTEDDAQRKVLLVEDDASVLASLRLVLKGDYEVHSASTIASGINLFISLQPSLVVLDLRLSDGDGMDVLRAIRRLNQRAPVIVLTGYASMKTAEESLRLGASDYLHKPFDGKELRSRIHQLTSPVPPQRQMVDDESVLVPRQWLEELERKAEASALFLHDAANPVTTALTSAQLLCDIIEGAPEQFNEELRGLCELLYSSMGFIAGLFEQSGSIEFVRGLKTSEVALHRVVDLAVAMVRGDADKHKVAVLVHVQDRNAKVRVNRFALARVLLNLLRNAIAAVDPNTGRVVLSADIIDGLLEFSVLDNGPGIPFENIERIFEAHFTTKETGTGLGLFISKSLVLNMSGEISVRNEPGKGCCFTVKIPCVL